MITDLDRFARACRQSKPRIFVVLGSGQGLVGQRLGDSLRLPFSAVAGMPAASVAGHKGCFALGRLAGVAVLLAEGRVHGYEGHGEEAVTRSLLFAAECGVRDAVLTNAAGGIRDDLVPGSIMPLAAHQDWQRGTLPAREPNPYSPELLRLVLAQGHLVPGCYAAVAGPSYETPAEIRALRSMGANAVGMSTAPEARAAAALGLRVAGLSLITNRAAGLATGTLDHHDVLAVAKASAEKLADLLERVLKASGAA